VGRKGHMVWGWHFGAASPARKKPSVWRPRGHRGAMSVCRATAKTAPRAEPPEPTDDVDPSSAEDFV